MLNYHLGDGILSEQAGERIHVQERFVVMTGSHEAPHGVLYEPEVPHKKSRIGIVAIHSDQDYSTMPIGWELARRGYRVLAGQVSSPGATLDQKMLDIKHAVRMLHCLDGVEKVVLMGHSGGATLMSAYQAAAERGVQIWQTENLIHRCTLTEELVPADGMLILDSNFGNGAMTLLSIDPAVIEEGNGVNLDPALDIYNPQNGYDPVSPEYSDSFLSAFWAAQRERNNVVVRRALDRLTMVEKGKGNYLEDEPFLVTGAAQVMPCNKLIPQDTRLLSHTKHPWPLLHHDGSMTTEIIHCLRKPRCGENPTPRLSAAVIGTVRSFLSNRAVMAGEEYAITAEGVQGVLWNDSYSCTPGNVRFITAPALIMGMTGSYEYLAAETVYEKIGSADKSILFVEGAGHNFDAAGREMEFGDTAKRVYDACDHWMSAEGRFL